MPRHDLPFRVPPWLGDDSAGRTGHPKRGNTAERDPADLMHILIQRAPKPHLDQGLTEEQRLATLSLLDNRPDYQIAAQNRLPAEKGCQLCSIGAWVAGWGINAVRRNDLQRRNAD